MLNRIGKQARTATLIYPFVWQVGLLVCMIGTFGTVMLASEATYRWHGELVTLDETSQMLTVKARAVSQAGLTGVEGLRMGEPIVITWSGYENQANGIRSVAPDLSSMIVQPGSNLWGGNEFLLQAEFVAMDAAQQSLTFKAAIPDGSLAAVRALTRGAWATVTSPHRPGDGMASLLMVDAYDVTERPMSSGPAAGATYQWHGELVTLDETSQMLMVKARAVSQAGLAGAEGLRMGAPIAITWSGYENQANGIRSVALDDGSGLWGGNEFLLQAEFVAMDAAQQSLTFKAAIPDGSLAAVRALTRGAWATVTSPHRPGDGMASLLMVDAYDVTERVRRYVWPGQIVSLNQTEKTVSVSAPVEQHVFRYVDRFSAGDEVVLIWSPNGRDEAKAIRYLEHREELILDHGYVLPVQFVSAHAESQRIVFKTKLSPSMFARSALIQAGKGIKVTSPFDQSGETAAIMIVDPAPEA